MILKTSKGIEFIIDKEDKEKVIKHSWCCTSSGYLHSRINGKYVYLHRYLLNPPSTQVVDHINHNKLDNQKSNLRITTQLKNAQNRQLNNGGTSKHIGVYYNKRLRKWIARIRNNYLRIHLGCFVTEQEAITAYLVAKQKYHTD
jgi:hypothetical protein